MIADGRLMTGRVNRSAAAGPAPKPAAISVCAMGISPAVGMTNSNPAKAKPIIARELLPQSGLIVGNNQARTPPRIKTVIT